MKVIETQAYLDEANTSSVITSDLVRASIKSWVQQGGKAAEQASRLARLLAESEIGEPDDELRGLYEEGFQTLGAIRRLVTDVERSQRDLLLSLTQLDAFNKRVQAQAKTLGYT